MSTPLENGFTLYDLDDGKLLQRVELALMKVAKDIFDYNKNATDKRTVKLEIEIKPSETRREADVSYQVTETLGKVPKQKAKIFIGQTQTGVQIQVYQEQTLPMGGGVGQLGS